MQGDASEVILSGEPQLRWSERSVAVDRVVAIRFAVCRVRVAAAEASQLQDELFAAMVTGAADPTEWDVFHGPEPPRCRGHGGGSPTTVSGPLCWPVRYMRVC